MLVAHRSFGKKRVPVVEKPPRRLQFLATNQKKGVEIDHSHAGFPQGFLDATNLILLLTNLFVASWLTNAIDRIVKDLLAAEPRTRRPTGHVPARPRVFASLDLPTPSAGARLRDRSLPGRRVEHL